MKILYVLLLIILLLLFISKVMRHKKKPVSSTTNNAVAISNSEITLTAIEKKWKLDNILNSSNENQNAILVFNQYNIKILFIGYREGYYRNKVELVFKVINNRPDDICIQCDGLSVNNKMCNTTMSSHILKYSTGEACCNTYLSLSELKDRCVIHIELALCNNFLDNRRYKIESFMNLSTATSDYLFYDLSKDLDIKNTKEYLELLKSKQAIEEALKNKEVEQPEEEITVLASSAQKIIEIIKESIIVDQNVIEAKEINSYVNQQHSKDYQAIITDILKYYIELNHEMPDEIFFKLVQLQHPDIDDKLCKHRIRTSYFIKHGSEALKLNLLNYLFSDDFLEDTSEQVRTKAKEKKIMIEECMVALKDLCKKNNECTLSKTKVQLKRKIMKCDVTSCNYCPKKISSNYCCVNLDKQLEYLQNNGYIEMQQTEKGLWKVTLLN